MHGLLASIEYGLWLYILDFKWDWIGMDRG